MVLNVGTMADHQILILTLWRPTKHLLTFLVFLTISNQTSTQYLPGSGSWIRRTYFFELAAPKQEWNQCKTKQILTIYLGIEYFAKVFFCLCRSKSQFGRSQFLAISEVEEEMHCYGCCCSCCLYGYCYKCCNCTLLLLLLFLMLSQLM